jgi:aminopeptidase N
MSHRVLLPSDVIPEQYDLTLEPDVERFTFDGLVKITVNVEMATDVVQLHSRDLLIKSAKFTSAETGGESMEASEVSLNIKEYILSIKFEEVLPVGKGELEIVFQGTLNDQMAGFYRSKYTDSKGVQRHLATTQFEAIDARRCFPCWDEPGRKAVFVVTLIYAANLMAVSNMPQSRSEIAADGRRKELFMPTPKMSTYLLAFCVGEFEYISGMTKEGTIARVMACPGNLDKMSYALTCTIKSLEFYNDFFGIPYPLPKVDMIAIPDFSAGAMENWGLVTYREVALLCDEKTVSAVQKQRICTVVAHELAHQWFGNLVTMAWWDDLWLNEGFAAWMQNFCSGHIHPEWNIWESFVGTEQQQALKLDSLRSSHPIQVPIGKAQEVEEVFDAISYMKGASTVRMIYALLGQEKFQEGLKLYFKRHKYGNTNTSDLWSAWADVSGKPLQDMMSSWTEKMGFPVVKVLKDPFTDGSKQLQCEQSWFLADGSSQPGDADKLWYIPMFIGSDAGTKQLTLQEKQATLDISFSGNPSWIKLNFGQEVPMRVLYPAPMVARLAANVQSLSAQDRIGLLSDSFALVKAGMQDPEQLVRLISGFKAERNDKVWAELAAHLASLDSILRQCMDTSIVEGWQRFSEKLSLAPFLEVGWETRESDDDNAKKLRTTLASLMAKFSSGDAEHMKAAQQKCDAFLTAAVEGQDCNSVLSADVRQAALRCGMKAAPSSALFDRFVAAHNKATDGTVRQHIYAALADSPDKALRQRALDWALTDDVRSQDLIYLPMFVASSGQEGGVQCFEWVKGSFGGIYGRLGETSQILFQHVVKISGMGFASEEKAQELKEFWESKPCAKMISKCLQQTVEGIKTNAQFAARLKASRLADPAFWKEFS